MNKIYKIALAYILMLIISFHTYGFRSMGVTPTIMVNIINSIINILITFLLLNLLNINKRYRIVFSIILSIMAIIVTVDSISLFGDIGDCGLLNASFFILPPMLSFGSTLVMLPLFSGIFVILDSYHVILNYSYFIIPLYTLFIITIFIKPLNVSFMRNIFENKKQE